MRLYRKIAVYTLICGVIAAGFGGCASKKKYKKGTPATMKTYCVRGKSYSPDYVRVGQKMRGISSWYGPNFHGKKTSNGETYNMHARTAAHKTWPMNTMVKVTNLQNGKSTIVRINDRGPFVRGRIIDCSYTAGKEIGLDRMGIAKVEIEVLGFAGKIIKPAAARKKPKKKKKVTEEVLLTNFGIQLGAFNRLSGARALERRHAGLYEGHKMLIKKTQNDDGRSIYRVWLMGFETEEEAQDFIACNNLRGAFTVRN